MRMEILEVLSVLLVFIIILVIFAYECLDRHQFRIERQWKPVEQHFLDWLEAVEYLSTENAEILALTWEFRKTRRIRDKAALADQILAKSAYIGQDEGILAKRQYQWNRKEQIERELAGFVQVYNEFADIFNKKLEGKIYGIVAKLLRIRPYPCLKHWSRI